MAERQTPPARRSSSDRDRRQAQPRRTDVIRCENCGEDYSITYKRCPFCDERPGRGGVGGKRVANARGGGYGRPVNPIQVAGLVISLILIISALFIVFRFVGAPLIHGGKAPGSQSNGSSQSANGSQTGGSQTGGSTQQPGSSSTPPSGSSSQGGSSSQPGGSTQQPDPPTPPVSTVQSIRLNKTDFTLNNGEKFQMTATLSPSGAQGTVTWSSSNTAVATVDANGLVTNVNTGTKNTRATLTAACGDVKAECVVYCKPKSGGTTDPGTIAPDPGTTTPTSGTVVNASDGLRVRSGPGTNYDRIGSVKNGEKLTIQGEENGWYKIAFGNGSGYVSKQYVRTS